MYSVLGWQCLGFVLCFFVQEKRLDWQGHSLNDTPCHMEALNRREGATPVATRCQRAVIDSRRRVVMGGCCQQPVMALCWDKKKLKPRKGEGHVYTRTEEDA